MTYNSESRKCSAQCTRQQIYERARELFLTRDYAEVSVDSIVRAAGVSKGSFYVHFGSKDALFALLVKDYVASVDTDYRRLVDSFRADTPAGEMLLGLVARIADVLTGIGCDKMRILYRALITNDADTNAVTSYSREIYRMFNEVLERGIRRGEFQTDLPLEDLTRHFMMAIRGITYEWCIRHPHFDFKSEALAQFRLLLRGLRPNPEPCKGR